MASLGHVAVGLTVPRFTSNRAEPPRWQAMAAWSALSLLPDADVIGFAMGVRYADPWGHRGASHSVVFALAMAALIAAIVPPRRLSRPQLWLTAFAVLVSHGLLDTLTDGGLGVALFWPFDLTRYFAPWRPIPVAPIGLGMFTEYGAMVSLFELALFAPLIVFALWPRRAAWLLTPVWVAAVWLLVSSSATREAIVGALLRDRTQFAPGFSEPAFRSMQLARVRPTCCGAPARRSASSGIICVRTSPRTISRYRRARLSTSKRSV
jgi:inner membrane protein